MKKKPDWFVGTIWLGTCAAGIIVFLSKPFLARANQPYVFPAMCLICLLGAAIILVYSKVKYGRFMPWRASGDRGE